MGSLWQGIVLLFIVKIVSSIHVEVDTSECWKLLELNPETFDVNFTEGKKDEKYGYWTTNSSSGFTLQNWVRFHVMTKIHEQNERSILCVSYIDSTTYTGKNFDAWVTLHTRQENAVGLIEVDTSCWRTSRGAISGCNPAFKPLPYIPKLPIYRFSPLEENLWSNLTEKELEKLGVHKDWIWYINAEARKGSIEAKWVSTLDITSLETLQIVGNNWKIPSKLIGVLPKLETLDLSRNNLEEVPEGSFKNTPLLKNIILGHNNLSRFPSEVNTLKNLSLLDLTNPLGNATLVISDQDIKSLPESLETLGLENTNLIINVSNLFKIPNLKFLNLSGCAFEFIDNSEFKNNLAIRLQTLDLSFNKLNKLPAQLFLMLTNLETLYLQNNKFTTFFNIFPSDNKLSTLNLAHNEISSVSSDAFNNTTKLTSLNLSWNHIQVLPPYLTKTLKLVTKIDISHNQIYNISEAIFKNTPKLTRLIASHNKLLQPPKTWNLNLELLDLSHNELTYFGNENSVIQELLLSYNKIKVLEIENVTSIDLSYNSIRYLTSDIWKNLAKVKEIRLEGNDFDCCNDTKWTEMKNLSIRDYNALTCTVNQTSPKILISTLSYNESLCFGSLNEDYKTFKIELILPLSLLTVAVIVIALMMYIYRFEFTYISHLFEMKKAGLENDEQRYKSCIYDAFICYNAKNFQWVVESLLPNMEGGEEGFRFCLHDRDFVLGAGINRNIVASLEKSRKVIFVLTPDFIASKWCQWELEMANHKMFEEKRNYIILIELEKLDKRLLPRHLRYLMDRTTYLEWPQQADDRRREHCFRRLREALGDSLLRRTGRENKQIFTVLDA